MSDNKLTVKEKQIIHELIDELQHPQVRDIRGIYSPRVRAILRNYYDTKKYITVGEAAIWLDKHPDTIYAYIKKGRVVAFRLGSDKSNWFVDVEETKKKFKNC